MLVLDQNQIQSQTTSQEDISALDLLVQKRRACRAPLPFSSLSKKETREFVDRAAQECLQQPGLEALVAAARVAVRVQVALHECDRPALKKRILRRKSCLEMLSESLSSCDLTRVSDKENEDANGDQQVPAWVNRARCGRKRDDDLALPSSQLQRPFKGADSHSSYSIAVKKECAAAAKLKLELGHSLNHCAKRMQASLASQGITIGLTMCKKRVSSAVSSDGRVCSPQKPGGCYVPSAIEARIAEPVRLLRAKKFPVFPEDIMKWCTEEIRGTDYALNFPEGRATEGWYRGFLRRQGFLTGTVRPLEMTRAEWFTSDNLKQYFEVAAQVLIDAGVAVANRRYEAGTPYSEPIVIIHPERICSYDETRLELDCTKGGKGKVDRIVRGGMDDDGSCLATKSSNTATTACGRTGDGKPLPPYIIFSSGEEYDVAWAPHIESDELCDPRTGKNLAWRYNSNSKGSMTEEMCVDYFEQTLYPALGCPPPRDDKPGEQGVIVCDGVGTHTGMQVLTRMVALGCECILRVPNLSFVLQGEDTVNFKELKAGALIYLCFCIGFY